MPHDDGRRPKRLAEGLNQTHSLLKFEEVKSEAIDTTKFAKYANSTEKNPLRYTYLQGDRACPMKISISRSRILPQTGCDILVDPGYGSDWLFCGFPMVRWLVDTPRFDNRRQLAGV
ncbi:hypothetical protein TWF192_002728 [Orbilia oligospora]|uniref:Uncharacterized protein n=1 Tax=Orbilia oligospora TaxID=2813651 RepID=A0A6G1MEC8_ORBOL|nr:hypothetical protein TWF679_009106 [Orbilia oligospora]KAF3225551.1 hypothetical protein TWF191_005253 [Orbilia oligospora]KAF3255373.1 hypothetical protein TWF192_002728 [Orbilia oligospora]